MPLRYLKPIKWTSFFLPKSVFPLDFLLVSSTTITQLFKYPCFLPFFYLPHSWQDTVISTSRIQPDLCSPLLSSKFKSSYFVLTSASFLLASIIGYTDRISTQQPEEFFKIPIRWCYCIWNPNSLPWPKRSTWLGPTYLFRLIS